MRYAWVLAAIAVVAFVMTACGGGSDKSSTPAEQTYDAGIDQARQTPVGDSVREYAGQLCDPLHPIVRQLNDLRGKPTKKRTLDEHQQIADLEWTGGLYLNEKNEPCIPSENVESMLTEAASKVSRKKGDAQAAIIVDGDLLPIDYGPKRSLEEMKRDPKFRLRKATGKDIKIMLTRPRFPVGWCLTFKVLYMPDVVGRDEVIKWVKFSAWRLGLGAWTPRYGRFEITEVK